MTELDELAPEKIKRGLKTKLIGKIIYHCQEISSTMEIARELAKQNAPEGTIVIAESQTEGRGRFRRQWLSPYGKGIWQSIILRPHCPKDKIGLITFAAAIAACKAIEKTCALPAKTKWPNDILINSKKIGGILCELEPEFLNLGIAINVNLDPEDFTEDLRANASSIKIESKHQVSRLRLEKAFLEEFENLYVQFKAENYQKILSEWRLFDITLGSYVKIQKQTETLQGEAKDCDENGNLILKLPTGSLKKIFSGDVYLLKSEN